MSLRTKLLAAILGLNGAILLLALYLLLRSAGGVPAAPTPQLVAELMAFGGAVAEAPQEPRRRQQALDLLGHLEATGLLTDVIVVEELGEEGHQLWSAQDFLAPGGVRDEVPLGAPRLAAQGAFQQARRQATGWTWTREDLVAVVLPGAVEGPAGERVPEDGAPAEGAPPRGTEVPGRRGIVARFVAPPDPRRGVRGVYVVMVVGAILLTAVAFALLSKLVIRPLRQLTEAADRIARGDYRIRVERRGTNDEFDRTTAAFNRMAREIAEYQGHLEDRVLSALNRMKKAEQHLTIAQRLAATGKLASGVAHEINNPLGGMKNALRALARGELGPEKTAQYLDLIEEGLGRIEETVKKFLSFTPRRVEPRPTDLVEIATKAAGLAEHRLQRSGARLEIERDPEAGLRVFGDPHELQQVALNLLLNAADAVAGRPDATVTLRVRRQGEEVVLSVMDNGVGLSPEDQGRCFDMFFTTKAVGEGSGLGLAVAHTIVTNHGGRIEVESTPGEGATFRVVLPAEVEPETPSAAG